MEDLDVKTEAKSIRDYIRENKKAKDIYVWVWNNFLSDNGRKIAWQIFGLMFAINLLSVLSSYYALRLIFDGVSMGSQAIFQKGFIAYAVILLIARVKNYAKQILREYFFDDFGGRLNEGVSRMFFEKSLGVHVNDDNFLNESNVKKGNDRVFDLVYIVMFEGVELIFVLLLSLVILLFVNWFLGLVTLGMFVMYLFWTGFINYRIMVDGYEVEKAWRFLYRYKTERWKNVERVKNNAKEEEELQALNSHYQKVSKSDLALWIWTIKWSFLRGLAALVIFLFALWYGGSLVLAGVFSAGWLYPIISLSSQVLDNLWRMGDLERKIHYNLHSVGRLKEALELPVGLAFHAKPVKLNSASDINIEFDSISYRFNDDPKSPFVLSGISFSIGAQEKVALIGTSGAGKSTLMKLLLRYMDPTTGSIRIAGRDLRDVDLGSWLDLVGYIPQQPQILSGSIKYNLLYGLSEDRKRTITEDYIWEQMRTFQVDFGDRLTNGLETKVGHNGIKLSGGQNQRLMILAAALKEPRFMVIDEATSSLDSSTEKLVQAGLETALSRNCGALIVAHRLSTVRRICDKFIVIEPANGSGSKIVGVGKSFEELFDVCPQFRKLAEDQEVKIS